jgi:hypothetical protein
VYPSPIHSGMRALIRTNITQNGIEEWNQEITNRMINIIFLLTISRGLKVFKNN